MIGSVLPSDESLAVSKTQDRKRQLHTESEQRRRHSIKIGYDQLQQLIHLGRPGQDGHFLRLNREATLNRAIRVINKGSQALQKKRSEIEQLKMKLNTLQILNNTYGNLPSVNSPVTEFSNDVPPDNMRHNVFKSFMRALFKSFDAVVSVAEFGRLSEQIVAWLELNCTQDSLRTTMEHVLSTFANSEWMPMNQTDDIAASYYGYQNVSNVESDTNYMPSYASLESEILKKGITDINPSDLQHLFSHEDRSYFLDIPLENSQNDYGIHFESAFRASDPEPSEFLHQGIGSGHTLSSDDCNQVGRFSHVNSSESKTSRSENLLPLDESLQNSCSDDLNNKFPELFSREEDNIQTKFLNSPRQIYPVSHPGSSEPRIDCIQSVFDRTDFSPNSCLDDLNPIYLECCRQEVDASQMTISNTHSQTFPLFNINSSELRTNSSQHFFHSADRPKNPYADGLYPTCTEFFHQEANNRQATFLNTPPQISPLLHACSSESSTDCSQNLFLQADYSRNLCTDDLHAKSPKVFVHEADKVQTKFLNTLRPIYPALHAGRLESETDFSQNVYSRIDGPLTARFEDLNPTFSEFFLQEPDSQTTFLNTPDQTCPVLHADNSESRTECSQNVLHSTDCPPRSCFNDLNLTSSTFLRQASDNSRITFPNEGSQIFPVFPVNRSESGNDWRQNAFHLIDSPPNWCSDDLDLAYSVETPQKAESIQKTFLNTSDKIFPLFHASSSESRTDWSQNVFRPTNCPPKSSFNNWTKKFETGSHTPTAQPENLVGLGFSGTSDMEKNTDIINSDELSNLYESLQDHDGYFETFFS